MASELSASLEETAASLEEINSMVQQNDRNALEASSSMQENEKNVHRANDEMESLQQSMHRIKVDSDRIAGIIKEIEGIAFQTNLLALNAAVEAARAGEHGQGFAVVAEEVRSLAQRTAKSAQDSGELLGNALSNVDDGLGRADTVARELQEITASSHKVSVVVGEIAVASHDQAAGIGQISLAVNHMDSGTQQLATNSDALAEDSRILLEQTTILNRNIQRLLELAEGKDAKEKGEGFSLKRGDRTRNPKILMVNQ